MSYVIWDKALQQKLHRYMDKAQGENADAVEKLASGTVFTSQDPRPADRALAEGLEYRIRSLTASKRNINDAISLLQTAESSMSEVNNMVLRMKELNLAAANTTVSDRDRKFMFIEYEALHDEVNRIAESTEFNGIPLLNGLSDKVPDELVFRVDDPHTGENGDEDINSIRFDGIKSVVTTTAALGIKSAKDLLFGVDEEEGISTEMVEEMLVPDDDEYFSNVYDRALHILTTQRSVYGGLQARMQRALDYADVFQENISAAKSRISDTDYAHEVSRLANSKILLEAATSVMAQTNQQGRLTMELLNSI